MAAAFQINVKIAISKLELLKQLQEHISDVLTDYIDKIVSVGKSWIESKGDQETFSKIKQKIDNAVDFLTLKCQEISDQLETETSVEHTSQERQSIPESEAGTQSSPAVTATSQQSYITQSGQDKDLFCQVSTTNLDKVTKQQTDVDKRFEDVTAMLKNIQEQLNDLCTTDEKQKNQLKEHADKIVEIQQQESKLHSLEKQIKKLSTKQKKLEAESLSNSNAYEELDRWIKEMSEDTASQISAVNARLAETDSSVQDLLNRVGSQEQAIQSLCTNVDTNMETFETVSTRQERNAEKLRQFEDRMQKTETRVREKLEKVGGQFQEAETNFQNVCQLLSKRLEPLEQLRDTFNQKAKARDENLKQLQEIVKEVAIMSPKLTQLENKLTRPAVGFSAWAHFYGNIPVGTTITSYDSFNCYNSGHFDCATGVFTVPVAGTYVCCLTVYTYESKVGEVQLNIKCKKIQSRVKDQGLVYVTAPNEKHVCSFAPCFVQLEIGDKLSVVMNVNKCNVKSGNAFHCFMIR